MLVCAVKQLCLCWTGHSRVVKKKNWLAMLCICYVCSCVVACRLLVLDEIIGWAWYLGVFACIAVDVVDVSEFIDSEL